MRGAIPLVIGSLLVASSPAAADEITAIARARAFWDALKQDKVAAQAMVAGDAEMGAGDVGGPFDLAAMSQIRDACEIASELTTKPLEMDGRNIDVVEATLACTGDGGRHPVLLDFMIGNDKIAGIYLPRGSAVEKSGQGAN